MKALYILIVAVILSACGGSGGSTNNQAAPAQTGQTQTTTQPEPVAQDNVSVPPVVDKAASAMVAFLNSDPAVKLDPDLGLSDNLKKFVAREAINGSEDELTALIQGAVILTAQNIVVDRDGADALRKQAFNSKICLWRTYKAAGKDLDDVGIRLLAEVNKETDPDLYMRDFRNKMLGGFTIKKSTATNNGCIDVSSALK